MKAKKYVSLVLSLLMVLSCMQGMTFGIGAEEGVDDTPALPAAEEAVEEAEAETGLQTVPAADTEPDPEPETETTEETRTIIASGNCGAQGDNVTYTLYSDGEMVIEGEGEIEDCKYFLYPWYHNRHKIRRLIICEGITSIPINAFYSSHSSYNNSLDGYHNLYTVTIPSSVTDIRAAFSNCTKVIEVCNNSSVSLEFSGLENSLHIYSASSGKSHISTTDKGFVVYDDGINRYLIDYVGNESDITLPSHINGNTYSIFRHAFSRQTNLISVVIPAGVDTIGSNAFFECSNLTTIHIPSSVTKSGTYAFYNCENLQNVTTDDLSSWCDIVFSDSTSTPMSYAKHLYINGELLTELIYPRDKTIINDYVFMNCTDLVLVDIPDETKTIGKYAFAGCSNLTDVVMSVNSYITSIGIGAFRDCTSLTFIELPGSVTSIDSYIFAGCTALESVWLPDGITSIPQGAFDGCTNLVDVVIPYNVTSIEYQAFHNCSSLTSIDIPDKVTSIGDRAFQYCNALAEVHFGQDSQLTYIRSGAFQYCSSLESFDVPVGVKSIEEYAFGQCTSLSELSFAENAKLTTIGTGAYQYTGITSLILPASVKRIGTRAFAYTYSLVTVVVEDGSQLTTIGEYAFNGDSALASFTFPEDAVLTTIGTYAFQSCNKLSEFKLPTTVTSIGASAFKNCAALTEITIPAGVTAIQNDTFNGCSALKTVTFAEGSKLTSIGNYAFNENTSLGGMDIPAGVTSIGSYAFNGNRAMSAVTFAENSALKSIGTYAFFGCSKLADFEIPAEVTSIGAYAFRGCSSLTTVTVPAGVSTIGERTFYGCSGLTEIDFAEDSRLTTIGDYAFYGCRKVSSIRLPETLTALGLDAFARCTALKNIYFTGNAPTFGVNTFLNVTANAYYPENDATWTEDIMLDYGGDITWIPYDPTAVHVHTYETVVTAPTCTEQGYTTYTCICGESYVSDYTEALNHTVVIDEAIDADCVNNGLTEGSHCELCGEIIVAQEVIPAYGHTYSSVVTAPTYEFGGYTTYTCSVCGDSYVDNYTDKLVADVEMVFVIDTTESMEVFFGNVVENIKTFAAMLEESGMTYRLALVSYRDYACGEATVMTDWYTDLGDYTAEVDALELGSLIIGGGDRPETVLDGLGGALTLDFHAAERHIVLITESNYKTDNSYGYASMDEVILALDRQEISVTVITHAWCVGLYRDLAANTNGLLVTDILGEFSDDLWASVAE